MPNQSEKCQRLAELHAGLDGTPSLEEKLVPFLPGASVHELAAHGARRISLGAALTWASLKPVLDASKEMLEDGTFGFLAGATAGGEVQRLLA